MPGAGLYLVGASQTYKTLQAAVDALKVAQGLTPFAATQTIRIVDSLAYTGCVVDSLVPTSQYRLVIETTASPVLTGTFNPAGAFFGVQVNSVPFVTLRRLRIHGFHQGAMFFDSSDAQILDCTFTRNSLYGVALWNSHRTFFSNTTLQESDTLIALHRSVDTAFMHVSAVNFANGRYALWFDWQGAAHNTPLSGVPWRSLSSIFIGRGVPPILMNRGFEKDFDILDGNVYWSDVQAVASLYEIDEDGVREDRGVFSIGSWRSLTKHEDQSVFADPAFVTATLTGLPGINLELDTVSDLPGTGVNPANYPAMTSYQTSEAIYDADGRPRDLSAPTPGARELIVDGNYDFLDFFADTSPPDTSVDADGVDRSIRQIERSVNVVYPRVGKGHFFARDHGYYLFAEKQTKYLGEVAWSKLSVPVGVTIDDVSIGGTSVPWRRTGSDVWANHLGLVTDPTNDNIRVVGVEADWDTSNNEFDELPYTSDFPVVENPVEFYTDDMMDGAPVVVTDDTLTQRSSRNIIPFEFDVSHDGYRTKLHLQGERNLFLNPHFDASGTDWGSSGATRTFEQTSGHIPLIGRNYCRTVAPSAQTLLEQRVWRRDENKDMALSFYAHLRSQGILKVRVSTYDETSLYATQDFTSELVHDDAPYLGDGNTVADWVRYGVFLAADPSSELDPASQYDVLLGSGTLQVGGGQTAKSVKISLLSVGAITSDFDGMMISEGNKIERYAGLPYGDGMTLEYEGSDRGFYEIKDLALTPMLNPQNNGFLIIGPVRGKQLLSTASEDATTLNDVDAGLRFLLPWAKLEGPDKLLCVPAKGKWRDRPFGLPVVAGDLPALRGVQKIECAPDPIHVAQGLQGYARIRVMDDRNNPYAYETSSCELLTDTERYPGHLGLRELSVASQLGTEIFPLLDSAGSASFAVIAPDPTDVQVDVEDGTLGSTVETWYPINEVNHGNPTLRKVSDGSLVSLEGDETSETLSLEAGDPYASVELERYPIFGSVKVEADGTSEFDAVLEETLSTNPNQYQFVLGYNDRSLRVAGQHRGNIRVTYRPRLVWVVPGDDTTFHVDSSLAGIADDTVLRYDAKAILRTTIGGKTLDTDVVYTNPDA